ncbi:Uncharacterized protein dnm_011480 [Desulfonema magnum]|uniref:Uncharacterized protein n=1 Tax=Desulfonema magnum TaxID=45655 RepID=A0A975BH09_9BACT|nr:Uncharacterized protein dnm_011480 [Desulfonema magnum]
MTFFIFYLKYLILMKKHLEGVEKMLHICNIYEGKTLQNFPIYL